MSTRFRLAAVVAAVATAASARAAEPSAFALPGDAGALEAARSVRTFVLGERDSFLASGQDQAAVAGAIRGGEDLLFALIRTRADLLSAWPSRGNLTERRDAWSRLVPVLVAVGRRVACDPEARAALRSIAEKQSTLSGRDFASSVRSHHGLFRAFAVLAPEDEELQRLAEESRSRWEQLRQDVAASKTRKVVQEVTRSGPSSHRGVVATPEASCVLSGRNLAELHQALDRPRLEAATAITAFLRSEGKHLAQDAQQPEQKALIASMRLSDDFLVCVLPGMEPGSWDGWRSKLDAAWERRVWRTLLPQLVEAGRRVAGAPAFKEILASVSEGLRPHDASGRARAQRSLLSAFAVLAPEDEQLNGWADRARTEHARSRADAWGEARAKAQPPSTAEDHRDEERTRIVAGRLQRLAEVAKGQESAAMKTPQFIEALEEIVEDVLAEPLATTKGPALQLIARLQQLQAFLEALEAATNSSRVREWKTRVGTALGAAYSALPSTHRVR